MRVLGRKSSLLFHPDRPDETFFFFCNDKGVEGSVGSGGGRGERRASGEYPINKNTSKRSRRDTKTLVVVLPAELPGACIKLMEFIDGAAIGFHDLLDASNTKWTSFFIRLPLTGIFLLTLPRPYFSFPVRNRMDGSTPS